MDNTWIIVIALVTAVLFISFTLYGVWSQAVVISGPSEKRMQKDQFYKDLKDKIKLAGEKLQKLEHTKLNEKTNEKSPEKIL